MSRGVDNRIIEVAENQRGKPKESVSSLERPLSTGFVMAINDGKQDRRDESEKRPDETRLALAELPWIPLDPETRPPANTA